mgnify:FL=1
MSYHQVYINERPVQFVALKNSQRAKIEKGYLIAGEEDITPEGVFNEMHSSIPPTGIIYLCENPDRQWEKFNLLFKGIEASGGVVKNQQNEILVIYRRGKWDLPKGKIDEGETPEQAALREVGEECGLRELSLGALIATTFHTYILKDKRILKKTYWYEMSSNNDVELIPQLEEDIEKAVWMSEEQVRLTVFPDTYPSVKSVLEDFFIKQAD